jgi:hypothetical protein
MRSASAPVTPHPWLRRHREARAGRADASQREIEWPMATPAESEAFAVNIPSLAAEEPRGDAAKLMAALAEESEED